MKDTKPERFIEARVLVPRELSDAVCNFIVDNIASGLVLEEEEGSPNTGIMFYLPEEAGKANHRALETYLGDLLPGRVPDIREKLIENAAWEEQYKASIKPMRIAEDIIVRPPWESAPTGTRFDIVVEPKMAFGTGSHETTRSCLSVIHDHFQPHMRFLDLGTGSGILSILADKMGASYIKAIDYDS
ncbi:MAG TPA: 50S ribosomal protein L11 methyltransferase, partial [Candidatus Acidoferrum sp.]|nr:50S ribosomal protein L11 methyltransferase [Candidatus Acidoferrum sp.]